MYTLPPSIPPMLQTETDRRSRSLSWKRKAGRRWTLEAGPHRANAWGRGPEPPAGRASGRWRGPHRVRARGVTSRTSPRPASTSRFAASTLAGRTCSCGCAPTKPGSGLMNGPSMWMPTPPRPSAGRAPNRRSCGWRESGESTSKAPGWARSRATETSPHRPAAGGTTAASRRHSAIGSASTPTSWKAFGRMGSRSEAMAHRSCRIATLQCGTGNGHLAPPPHLRSHHAAAYSSKSDSIRAKTSAICSASGSSVTRKWSR